MKIKINDIQKQFLTVGQKYILITLPTIKMKYHFIHTVKLIGMEHWDKGIVELRIKFKNQNETTLYLTDEKIKQNKEKFIYVTDHSFIAYNDKQIIKKAIYHKTYNKFKYIPLTKTFKHLIQEYQKLIHKIKTNDYNLITD